MEALSLLLFFVVTSPMVAAPGVVVMRVLCGVGAKERRGRIRDSRLGWGWIRWVLKIQRIRIDGTANPTPEKIRALPGRTGNFGGDSWQIPKWVSMDRGPERTKRRDPLAATTVPRECQLGKLGN